MSTKPSRRSKQSEVDDSQYESRLRMAWIDEGGIDLRAARANLLEFVAGLYADALRLMQPQPPEPAVGSITHGARKSGAKPKARVRRKKVPARGRKKVAARGKKKIPIRRKKEHKKRK